MGDDGDGRTRDGRTDPFDTLLRRAARLPTRAPGALPTTLASGFELFGGRFRVLRQLGSGGMGVVYEALDRRRGGPVAIKTLTRLDPRDIYRLKSEFRSLSDVLHPNLVRLHRLFGDEGHWFFSMELVDGVPFDRWVRPDGRLDRARLDQALPQLVAGTRAIHGAGVLHRDLKPSNMLITGEGRLVILDFGLAADPEPGGVGQTVFDGFMAGTPAYMAPEQAAGRQASEASDWYAVGAMIYEALSGALPFDGSVDEILEHKQAGDPPGETVTAVDAELGALCLSLLDRDPSRRPDGDAILDALGMADSRPGTVPPPAPAGEPALLGRGGELDALRQACARSEQGEAVVVRVHGGAGMGKTALVSAFVREQRERGRAVVLSGRCYERESLPYNAIDRLIDELGRHLRQLPPMSAVARMPRAIFALARIFPALARLDCVRNAPAQPIENQQELRRLAFDAFAELLARMRDHQPVILHIDDLHWADRDSTLLLARLFQGPQPSPLMLIVSHRTLAADDNPALWELLEGLRTTRAVHWLDCGLGPLPDETVIALARARLPDEHGGELDAPALAREAAGNPLFAEELVRHVVSAAGADAGDGLRLEAALEARLGEHGDDGRQLLSVLALAGRPLPLEVLRAAGEGVADAHAVLDDLRAAHLVAVDARGHITCYHDRIRALVLARLDHDDGQRLHRALALAWGGLAGGDGRDMGVDPELLFRHWLGAGERAEAGRHAVHAAAEARSALAFDRASALYREALSLLPATTIAELELRERMAECLSLSGRWAEAGDAFAEAADHARKPELVQHLRHQAALHLLGSGRRQRGMPLLQRSLRDVGLRWPRTRVGTVLASLMRLAWLRLRGGAAAARAAAVEHDPGESELEHLHRSSRSDDASSAVAGEILLAAAAVVPVYDLLRGVYYMTAFAVRGLRGDERAARAVAAGMAACLVAAMPTGRKLARTLAARCAELARAEIPRDVAAGALGFAGFAALLGGRLGEARELGAEGSQLLEGVGRAFAYQTWGARSVQGFALALTGRVGEAAEYFAASEEEARELGDRLALLGGSSVLRHLAHDDVAAAERLLDEKDALSEQVGEGGVIHDMVGIERVLVALYCGRGSEVIDRVPRLPAAGLAPFDTVALSASCALQALQAGCGAGRMIAVVRRARDRLQRAGMTSTDAMAQQLEAALHAHAGQRERALETLEGAIAAYRGAEMELHAVVAEYRAAQLRGEDPRRPRQRMLELGAVAPERWARLLAPGFSDSVIA